MDENATTAQYVGDINISSLGDSNLTSCTLSGADVLSFDINNSGSLFVASGVTFNYTTKQQYSLNVSCSNIAGISNTATITINLIDSPQYYQY